MQADSRGQVFALVLFGSYPKKLVLLVRDDGLTYGSEVIFVLRLCDIGWL